MVRGPRRGSTKEDNKTARKIAKMAANTHGGYAGMSIIEMLEQELTECCTAYLVLREAKNDGATPELVKQINEARGRIRGVAISVAMMRHPLRRYEQAWWDYVKKLEKRHLGKAKALAA